MREVEVVKELGNERREEEILAKVGELLRFQFKRKLWKRNASLAELGLHDGAEGWGSR